MRALNKRLVRNIKNSKAQFAAVVAVIFVGLLVYTSMTNTSLNMSSSLDEYYTRHNFADIFAEFVDLPVGTVARLAQTPGVRAVDARIVQDIRVAVGREDNPTLRLVSIAPDQHANLPFVQEGRIPWEGGERGIALLNQFALDNALTIGDEIELLIRGEPFPITVTGLVDSPEFVMAMKDVRSMSMDNRDFGIGLINYPLLQELLSMPGQANSAVFLVDAFADPDEVKDRLEDQLEGYGLKGIVTRENQMSHAMVSMELDQLAVMSTVIPGIFLAIAAAVIFMMVARLVQGDRISIGVLKALGYSDKSILTHYLQYSLLLGFLGSVPGMLLGYALANGLTELYLMYFHIPYLETTLYWRYLFGGIGLTLFFCGTTGFLAARGALLIAPADAMTSPAPPPGKRNIIEFLAPGLWKRLSFSNKLVLRGIFRNKRRFFLSLLGVAVTFAVILMPLYMLTVWDVIFSEQFGEMERYDYTIAFIHPVSSRVLPEIAALAPVTAMEPYFEIPFEITRGWRSESAMVRAIQHDAQLYQFKGPAGNYVPIPNRGIIVSEYMAQTMDLSTGDWVEISSWITRGESHRVQVRGIITQYLGSGVYMSLEEMGRITGHRDTYSGVVLNSSADLKSVFQGMGNIESVQSMDDIVRLFTDNLDLMMASVSIMVLMGGLLGFAILFNTTSVGISERIREFSSLRVLGFSRREVFDLILKENVIALVTGLLVGMPIGRGLTVAMAKALSSDFFFLPTVIDPRSYVYTGLLVVFFMTLVMGAVWLRVRKLNFLEALSSRLT